MRRRTISLKLDAKAHRRAGPQGAVYERLTLPEQKIADIETAKFIDEGKEIFHSSDKLRGTIGVSCDMCHSGAANTHPETYPKYQTYLQRVALLRYDQLVHGKPSQRPAA